MVSHAAADGDLSLAMLADWLHLVFISLWTGAVFIAGLAVMPGTAAEQYAGPHDRNAYIESLSTCATVALAGIFATGVFNAWHLAGTLAEAAGNPYSNLLLVKIGLVLLAAVLGGVNRFFVMPAVLAGCGAAATRFTRTLQAEAAVLIAVLVVAALLASTSPPMAG
jgi:putative copper resistance protein D